MNTSIIGSQPSAATRTPKLVDPLFPNRGKRWNDKEDHRLKGRWASGAILDDLESEFGRTAGALAVRMIHIGVFKNIETIRSLNVERGGLYGMLATELSEYNYTDPAPRGITLTLLTKGKMQVTGVWVYGGSYIAWQPLLARNRFNCTDFPPLGVTLTLLTKGNIQVTGVWTGDGSYVGWAPLFRRNLDAEANLGLLTPKTSSAAHRSPQV